MEPSNACLLFPVVEFVPRGVALAQVSFGSDTSILERLGEFVAGVVDQRAGLVGRLGGDTTRHNDHLDASHTRGKNQTLVITMHHDHNTDRPRRETPRVLPDIELRLPDFILGILNRDIEHLRPGEVLSETVGGGGLDATSRGGDEAFDGGGVQTAGEFLLLGFDTGDDGDGEELFVYSAVQLEDLADLDVSFGFGEMRGVAFLPEELSRSQEWLGVLEFPTDDVVPLVQLEREGRGGSLSISRSLKGFVSVGKTVRGVGPYRGT